jgi:hypothetical protein
VATVCNLLAATVISTGGPTENVVRLFKRSWDGGDAEGCWSLGTLFR